MVLRPKVWPSPPRSLGPRGSFQARNAGFRCKVRVKRFIGPAAGGSVPKVRPATSAASLPTPRARLDSETIDDRAPSRQFLRSQ